MELGHLVFQEAAVQVGVNLRGADLRVSEHFLHGTKVCPRLDQVGGEAVPEGVRAHVLADACSDHAPLEHGERHLTCHASALTSEEQRVFVTLQRDDICPVMAEVVVDGVARLLPNRDDALFVALADHFDHAVNEVHTGHFQFDQFGDAEATGVQHLKHGLVPNAFPTAHVHGADDAFNFFHGEHVRELSLRLGRLDELNRIGIHHPFNAQVLAEAAHATQHARLAVSCQTLVVEVSQKAFHVRQFDVRGTLDVFLVGGEVPELMDVPHVRQHGVLAQASLKHEVVFVALDGGVPVCRFGRHGQGIQVWLERRRASCTVMRCPFNCAVTNASWALVVAQMLFREERAWA